LDSGEPDWWRATVAPGFRAHCQRLRESRRCLAGRQQRLAPEAGAAAARAPSARVGAVEPLRGERSDTRRPSRTRELQAGAAGGGTAGEPADSRVAVDGDRQTGPAPAAGGGGPG